MSSVVLKMPMVRFDPVSKEGKMAYAVYSGREVLVDEGERAKYNTIRLFELENRRGKRFVFRLAGNGTYAMYGQRGFPIVKGSMRDPVVPEIGRYSVSEVRNG